MAEIILPEVADVSSQLGGYSNLADLVASASSAADLAATASQVLPLGSLTQVRAVLKAWSQVVDVLNAVEVLSLADGARLAACLPEEEVSTEQLHDAHATVLAAIADLPQDRRDLLVASPSMKAWRVPLASPAPSLLSADEFERVDSAEDRYNASPTRKNALALLLAQARAQHATYGPNWHSVHAATNGLTAPALDAFFAQLRQDTSVTPNLSAAGSGNLVELGWPQARQVFLDGYAKLDRRVGSVASRALNDGWVDLADRPDRPWMYTSFMGASWAHPLAALTYDPNVRGLELVTHEVGHVIQDTLATRHAHPDHSSRLAAEFAATWMSLQVTDYAATVLPSLTSDLAGDLVLNIHFNLGKADFELAAYDLLQGPGVTVFDLDGLWNPIRDARHPSLDADWRFAVHALHRPGYAHVYPVAFCAALDATSRLDSGLVLDVVLSDRQATTWEMFSKLGIDLTSPASMKALAKRATRALHSRLAAARS